MECTVPVYPILCPPCTRLSRLSAVPLAGARRPLLLDFGGEKISL